MVSVMLVDENRLALAGLEAAVSDELDAVVTLSAPDVAQALSAVAIAQPALIITDILCAAMEPSRVVPAFKEVAQGAEVIVVTNEVSDTILRAVFAAGARGFVVKDRATAALPAAVRAVLTGGTYIDPSVTTRLIDMARKGTRLDGPYGLTIQERRVLSFLPQGYTNRQIAQQLGLSEETVKTHLGRALDKLGLDDRVEAAQIVAREGLAAPAPGPGEHFRPDGQEHPLA